MMLRDTKLGRRISGKHLTFEETENVHPNHELSENPKKTEQDSGFKSTKLFKTPTKQKSRNTDFGMSMRTPEKQGALSRNRSGWDEGRVGNTPRSCRTVGKVSLGYHEASSTLSTPSKTVSKPPNMGLLYTGSSRPPMNGGGRTSNFTALSKGIPVTCNSYTTVNTVDVPHFELREDPSFWMDHNVQVMIRVRPLNGTEISAQGYNRCLKQESAQSLTWVGHPETRFTFDHVACETIDQETLFKMVGLPMVENCLSGYNSCMFAYGQTGSGKTHTMLGEINDLELKPSPNRGMTPRIFEFLFARITAEEESRKDERLVYSCKCSFLEIYNEQITDLLDPSSSNLQLREDVNNGVYVENLSEYEVHTVGDILKLLTQGSANRRVAATNMNRESSRSHSVFTCVIESREKDSTSNLRYARLNLVDLAGSERQKSSGSEGERLKEASSINKSLSTLGHVISVLVDGAHARTQHVPYRDSRLTFLLQDSLGGNSKTMIIANVSPSISSAFETLGTLKFAQRAKVIQNNAMINEDASGDVLALKHQIRLLKQELALHKRYSISRSLAFSSKDENCSNASSVGDDDKILRVSCKQLKSLETSLNGALRREKSTENSIKHLEAEIEQLNCLIRQREEENRCTKTMLKFRENKIQRMDSVLGGLVPVDSYLLEENNTLSEEIEILRAKVDKNPEVTRFAVENIRLLDQLKRYQDFCEDGEREMLLNEVSELRNQLVHSQQENHMNPYMEKEAADDKKEIDFVQSELKKSREELDKCRDNLNSCLEKNAILCKAKESTEQQLSEAKQVVERLEKEVVEIKTVLDKKNALVESLTGDLKSVICERNDLHVELLRARKEAEMTDALAQENEAIPTKAEQIIDVIIHRKYLPQCVVPASEFSVSVQKVRNTIVDMPAHQVIKEKSQQMKIMSNLRKIADLGLEKKVELMKDSIFYSLSSVTRGRESSGTLVLALCQNYDHDKRVLMLNNTTCFSFCTKEVATILGMPDEGMTYEEYQEGYEKVPLSNVPEFIKVLKAKFVISDGDRATIITASQIKAILSKMTVADEDSKQHFRKLMTFYLIDQVLVCGRNNKIPAKIWWLISNLEACEKVNWPKVTEDHLHKSLKEAHTWAMKKDSKQHSFGGAAPVLEAILYERIPDLKPDEWLDEKLPIQKWKAQRRDDQQIVSKLSKLTSANVLPCKHCSASTSGLSGTRGKQCSKEAEC